MIVFYRLLFFPVFLLMLPYYWLRMWRRGGYGHDFLHRLGYIGYLPKKDGSKKRVWIQAVSVGEVQAIEPLVLELIKTNLYEIVITTTTSTAYQLLIKKYADKVTKVGIFPVDFFVFSRKAWNTIGPDLAILMEGELWPEHIWQAHQRSVPIMIINGRISDRSFKRYSRFVWVTQWLLRKMTTIIACSQEDCKRYISLGADTHTTLYTANLKLEASIEPLLKIEEKKALKQKIGFSRQDTEKEEPIILMGSSIWSGEETILLEAMAEARKIKKSCRLILIPRHPERKKDIIRNLQKTSLTWGLHSMGGSGRVLDVYIVDTIGELRLFTQIADIILIGKSFPPYVGGQSPIEAANCAVPMVYGPNMTNFRQICSLLEDYQASICARDYDDAKRSIVDLIQNSQKRDIMIEAARKWREDNPGAVVSLVNQIKMLC